MVNVNEAQIAFSDRIEALRTHLAAQPAKETLVLSAETTRLIEDVFQVSKSGFALGSCLQPLCSLLEELLTIPNWIRRMTAAAALVHVANENKLDAETAHRFIILLLALVHDEKRELRDAGAHAIMSFPLTHQIHCANILMSNLVADGGVPVPAKNIEGSITFAGYFLAHAPRDALKAGLSIIVAAFNERHQVAKADLDYLRWHIAKAMVKFLTALLNHQAAASMLSIPIAPLPGATDSATATASSTIAWILKKVIVYSDLRCRKAAAEALALYLYITSTSSQTPYLSLLKDAQTFASTELITSAYDLYTHAYCCMLTSAAELIIRMADGMKRESYKPYYAYYIELYRKLATDFDANKSQSGVYQVALIRGIVLMEYHGSSSKLVQSFSLMKRLLSSQIMHCIDAGLLCVQEVLRLVPTYIIGQVIEVQLQLLAHHSSLPIAVSAKKALMAVVSPFQVMFVLDRVWYVMLRTLVDNADIKEACFKTLSTLLSENKEYIAGAKGKQLSKASDFYPSSMLINSIAPLNSPQNSMVGSTSQLELRPESDLLQTVIKKLTISDLLGFVKIVFSVIEHAIYSASSPTSEYFKVAALNALEPLLDVVSLMIVQCRQNPPRTSLIVHRAPVRAAATSLPDIPPEIFSLLGDIFMLLTNTITMQSLAARSSRMVGKLYELLNGILVSSNGDDYVNNLQMIREKVASMYNLTLLAFYVLTYAFNAYDDEISEASRPAVPIVAKLISTLTVPTAVLSDAMLRVAASIATARGDPEALDIDAFGNNAFGFLFLSQPLSRVAEEDGDNACAAEDIEGETSPAAKDVNMTPDQVSATRITSTELRTVLFESTSDGVDGDLSAADDTMLMDGVATGLPCAALVLFSICKTRLDEYSSYTETDIVVALLRSLRGDDIDEEYLVHGIAYIFGVLCTVTSSPSVVNSFSTLLKAHADDMQGTEVGQFTESFNFAKTYPLLHSFFDGDTFTLDPVLCNSHVPSLADVALKSTVKPDLAVLTFLLETSDVHFLSEDARKGALAALATVDGRAADKDAYIQYLKSLAKEPKQQRCSQICANISLQSSGVIGTQDVYAALKEPLEHIFYGDSVDLNVYIKNALILKSINIGMLLPDRPGIDIKRNDEFDFHEINKC